MTVLPLLQPLNIVANEIIKSSKEIFSKWISSSQRLKIKKETYS